MKFKIVYLFIALVSLLTVLAIDEFKPGDRYYFSISNSSGGITGGIFDYNLTDMNMTTVLQANRVTEFKNGIYYFNITTPGSTEPRVLQINGSYGTSGYLNLVDMIFIVSTRKTTAFEGMDDNFTNIETKVNTANTGIGTNESLLQTHMQNNFTKVNSNLTTIITGVNTVNTGIRTNESLLQTHMQNNFTKVNSNLTTIIIEVDSVEENQATITAQINTNTSTILSNLTANISSVRTDISTLNLNLEHNFTKVDSNLTKISANLTTVLARIGTPEGNATTLWDYMWGTLTDGSNTINLLYRIWRFAFRTTSGVET